jgi:hypothetical protein
VSDNTLLAPRSYGVIPADDLKTAPLIKPTQPDMLAFMMDAVQGILFLFPEVKSEQEEISASLEAALPEAEQEQAASRSVSFQDFMRTAEGKAFDTPPVIGFLKTLSSTYGCLTDSANTSQKQVQAAAAVTDAILEGAATEAQSCVEAGLMAAGLPEGDTVRAFVNVVEDIPKFARTVREAIQWSKVAVNGPTFTAVSRPTPPLADGTYYGYIKSLDTGSRDVRFDRAEYYQRQGPGDDTPQKLCQANGIPVSPYDELCNDYFVKDDHVEEAATIAKNVSVTYFEQPGNPGQIGTYNVSLAQLAKIVARDNGVLFTFVLKGGQVVAINGVYIA